MVMSVPGKHTPLHPLHTHTHTHTHAPFLLFLSVSNTLFAPITHYTHTLLQRAIIMQISVIIVMIVIRVC